MLFVLIASNSTYNVYLKRVPLNMFLFKPGKRRLAEILERTLKCNVCKGPP